MARFGVPREAAAAAPALRRRLAGEADENARATAVETLALVAEEPAQVAPVLFDALFDRGAAVHSAAAEGLRWLERRSPGFLLAAVEKHPNPRVRAASPETYDPDAGQPPEGLSSLVRWAQQAQQRADWFGKELNGCSVARVNALLDVLHHAKPPRRADRRTGDTPVRVGLLASSQGPARDPDDAADYLAGWLTHEDIRHHEVIFILTELATLGRGSRRAVVAAWPLLGSRDSTVRSLAFQAIWALGGGTEGLDDFARAHLTAASSPSRLVPLQALRARGVATVERFANEVGSCVGDPAPDVRKLAGLLVQWMDDDRCHTRPGDSVRVIPPLPPPPPPEPTPTTGSVVPKPGQPRLRYTSPGRREPTQPDTHPAGGG